MNKMKPHQIRYANLTPEQRSQKLRIVTEYNRKKLAEYYMSLGEEEYNKHLARVERRKNPLTKQEHIRNLQSTYHKYYSSHRNTWLKKKYGITLDEFNSILLSQNNICAICSRQLSVKTKDTHLDHNHLTNKVRGILCMKCNLILGHSKDNITILQNAIKYLEKHNG